MAIFDLTSHPWAYVTVRELADYWRISEKRVLAHLVSGDVAGIELSPKVFRIQTRTAIEFERRARFAERTGPPRPAVKFRDRSAPSGSDCVE
jgi:hypothetical protein